MRIENTEEKSLFGAMPFYHFFSTITADAQAGIVISGRKALILGIALFRGAITGDDSIEIATGYATSGDIYDATNGTVSNLSDYDETGPNRSFITWYDNPIVIGCDALVGRGNPLALIMRIEVNTSTSITNVAGTLYYKVYA